MEIRLESASSVRENIPLAVVVKDSQDIEKFLKDSEAVQYIQKKLQSGSMGFIHSPHGTTFFLQPKELQKIKKAEQFRKMGAEIASWCHKEKWSTFQVWGDAEACLLIAEGIMLAGYRFSKYKKEKNEFPLRQLLLGPEVQDKNAAELETLVRATYITRDLVNEPVIFMTATALSEEITRLGQEAGFKTEVFNKRKIESLKMGGLLGVNKGSIEPPTFTVLEYKPEQPVNEQPVILVGKGVVFDTGGLSLKDSTGMMAMKCDMAGAAAVIGAFYAAAKNKLPVHIVGLIPATDNRPGDHALAPGDVITISNGKTVEVLNTDAEGRLILADALVYASRYNPRLVIDLATLTGAAARAIGKEGIVFMGNAPEKIKAEFCQSGEEVHERLVEFPLWEEYNHQLVSDIADIKNIGEGDAGAITAGKFLEHFVDYDWMHLDIAGPAFIKAADHYRSKNATGVGVRLLYNFLKKLK